ncbi:hypothetical protein [Cohnella thermotolerans]|uniref:hypothetical protein n=1 Tax=Cohnella thermotolerans TaxID=329858 RepID=UPI00041535AB|nr:hypothetical protein [Cohnella thermotolerans]
MKNPFRRGGRPRTDDLLREIRGRIEEIESRFGRMEERLKRSETQPQIRIDNVHIHQPVLEKLEFRLDALDIEQLSGSLNLGNNFGAKMTEGREAAPKPQPPSSPQGGKTDSNPSPEGLRRTPSGFRWNNRR